MQKATIKKFIDSKKYIRSTRTNKKICAVCANEIKDKSCLSKCYVVSIPNGNLYKTYTHNFNKCNEFKKITPGTFNIGCKYLGKIPTNQFKNMIPQKYHIYI